MSIRYFYGLIGVIFLLVVQGCGVVRLAPSEAEKQNAYLHQRTVQAAAVQAALENCTGDLKELTRKAAVQSDAIVTAYGLPDTLPATETTTDLLNAANDAITQQALKDASKKSDWFAITDQLLAFGIALGGVVGGAAGVKTAAALKTIRDKNTALKEIVQGNELFKKQNAESVNSFKEAQQLQSQTTRELVAGLKT